MRTRFAAFFLLALLLSGCDVATAKPEPSSDRQSQFVKRMGETSLREIKRVRSPEGNIDAVLCLKDTNATVPTPTEVYLAKASGTVSGSPIFRADRVDGLAVDWQDSTTLKISAKEARTFIAEDVSSVAIGVGQNQSVQIEFSIEKKL